jgi:hypothetical protein
MQNFTRVLCGLLTVIFLSFSIKSNAQCTFTSSDGYTVRVDVRPVSAIAPADCQYGYNYNLNLAYNISFSGVNIPSSLYTLQGTMNCGPDNNFFSLPLNGGTGTLTTTYNPYRSTTDCAGATPSSLGCNSVTIRIQGPGLDQSSTCSIAAGGPLPVTLISFNGRLVNSNNVYLKWATASEISNKAFTVERSADARTWTAIKTIAGALNSSTRREYEYTDESLSLGTYYYRLAQTDVAGAKTYSNIISATITQMGAAKEMNISPNPNPTNQLFISQLGNAREWEMQIVNTAGANVFAAASLSSSYVQLPTLAPGLYFVKLKNKVKGIEKVIKLIRN